MSTNNTWEIISIHQLNYTILHMYMKIHVNKLHNSFQINKLSLKIEKPNYDMFLLRVGEYLKCKR